MDFLPPEIRLLIYSKILPKNAVNILYKDAQNWTRFWGPAERMPIIPQVPPQLFRLNVQIRHEVYHELSKRRFVVSQNPSFITSTEEISRGIPTGLRHCMREVVLDATVLCEPRIPIISHQFRINRLTLRLTDFFNPRRSSLYGEEANYALRRLCQTLYWAMGQGTIQELHILAESVPRDSFMDNLPILGVQKVLPILVAGECVRHEAWGRDVRFHWEKVQDQEAPRSSISRKLVSKAI